jgi:RNA recognition motif-containing protein
MDVKLYIGNLAYSTTEQSLQQLFSQIGTVTSVSLAKDRDSGQSKGFAFVTMETQAGAQRAISELDNHPLAGRPITVKLARPREGQPANNKSRATPAGYQSRLGAFGTTGQSVKLTTRKPGKPRGGYQSGLGAFGTDNKSGPTPPRRRGGSSHR